MSVSVLLAGGAAVLAALSLADLLAIVAARRGWRRRGPHPAGAVRGGERAHAGRFVSLRAGRRAARLLMRRGVPLQEGLGRRLAAAGVARPDAVGEVMALKLVLAAAALSVVLTRAGGGSSPALLALPVAAFLVPDVLIARRAAARARALVAEAPELLERVRLAAEAGLSPERALAAGAVHAEGLLSREVRAALAACELGLPRAEAFARLTARCPIPEVLGLTALVQRASLHGTGLGPGLAALARSSRAERARLLEERAQRAAPQIQLVVALVLVPAAMLLIGAALMATLG